MKLRNISNNKNQNYELTKRNYNMKKQINFKLNTKNSFF